MFPTPGNTLDVALPIVHCQADFLRPLVCGDVLSVALEPLRLDMGSFEVRYSFSCDSTPAAEALTRHLTSRAPAAGAAACPQRSIAGWKPRLWPRDKTGLRAAWQRTTFISARHFSHWACFFAVVCSITASEKCYVRPSR